RLSSPQSPSTASMGPKSNFRAVFFGQTLTRPAPVLNRFALKNASDCKLFLKFQPNSIPAPPDDIFAKNHRRCIPFLSNDLRRQGSADPRNQSLSSATLAWAVHYEKASSGTHRQSTRRTGSEKLNVAIARCGK